MVGTPELIIVFTYLWKKEKTARKGSLSFYLVLWQFLSVDKEGCHSTGSTTARIYHGQHLLYSGMAKEIIYLIFVLFHRLNKMSMDLALFSRKRRGLNRFDINKAGIQNTAANTGIHFADQI